MNNPSRKNGIISTAAEHLRYLGVTSDPNIKQITVVESTSDRIAPLNESLARLGLVLADKDAQSYFNESAPAAAPAQTTPAPAAPAPAAVNEAEVKIKVKGDEISTDGEKDKGSECGDDEEDDDKMDEAIASVTDTLETGFLGSVVESLLCDEALTEDEFESAINFFAEASSLELTRMMRECYYAENGDAAITAQEITEALALQKPLSEKRIMSRLVGGVKMRLQKSSAAEKKAARTYYRANKAKILKQGRMKRKKPSYQRKLARQVAKAISMGTRKESIDATLAPGVVAVNESFVQPAAPAAAPATSLPPSPTRTLAQAPAVPNATLTALAEAKQYLSRTPADPLRAELTQIVTESQEMADTFIEAASALGQSRYTTAAQQARTLSRSVAAVLNESASLTTDDLATIRNSKALLNGHAQVMAGELRRFAEAQKK